MKDARKHLIGLESVLSVWACVGDDFHVGPLEAPGRAVGPAPDSLSFAALSELKTTPLCLVIPQNSNNLHRGGLSSGGGGVEPQTGRSG